MAGIFGFFNFEKPGKGVDKPEHAPQEKKGLALFFSVFFRKFWKMVEVNLLYLVFCIPIVTIGPATAALTFVLKTYAEENVVWLWQDFWGAFKENFKKTFFFGVIDLAVAGSVFWVWATLPSEVLINLPPAFTFAKYFMLIPFVVYLFMRFYLYTIAVSYDSTFWKTIMDSFLLTMISFYKCLYIALLCIVLFLIHYITTVGLFTIPFYGFSMFGLLVVTYISPFLQKYAVPTGENSDGDLRGKTARAKDRSREDQKSRLTGAGF